MQSHSMQLHHRHFLHPPKRVTFVPQFRRLLRKLDLDADGIDVLAHSNGTTCAPSSLLGLFADPLAASRAGSSSRRQTS
jgi:hypothetical protein